MFKTIRDKLEGSLAENKTLLRVENKLKSFLDQNPDVDHYLSDHNRSKCNVNFWLGTILGGMIIASIIGIILICVFNMWHQLGYLNVPGMESWS